jgi:hypothetical protein
MDTRHGAGASNQLEDGRGADAALPDDAPSETDLVSKPKEGFLLRFLILGVRISCHLYQARQPEAGAWRLPKNLVSFRVIRA